MAEFQNADLAVEWREERRAHWRLSARENQE